MSRYLEGTGCPCAEDSVIQGKAVNCGRLVLPTIEAQVHQVAVATRNPEARRRRPESLVGTLLTVHS